MEIRDLVRERIIGNIKTGMKDEKGLPKKLSYFHVEEDKATSIDMVDIFKKLYPNKPTKLRIRFTSENPFNFKFKRYVNGKAVCIGNGKKAITVGKDDKNRTSQIEVACGEECQFYQSEKCKLKGNLKFALDGIDAGGVWSLNTSGGISLSNIASEIYQYKKAGMSIVDVPFELSLIEQQSLAYGVYYSIDLHRCDIKPQLIDIDEKKAIGVGVPEKNKLLEEARKEDKSKATSKKVSKETEKVEEKQEKLNNTNNQDKTEESKKEEDFSNYCILKSNMEAIIKGQKFHQLVFEKMDGKDVEYILHPKADNEILSCGIGTVIEVTEAKTEMEKNVLCLYNIKQKMEKSEGEKNTEALKEAV